VADGNRKHYDLALYFPWEYQDRPGPWFPCTTSPLKSTWYVHFTFSWAASIPGDHTCYNNNHALAFPYIQEGGQFPPFGEENPYKTFPLPIPVYKKLAPINLDSRKDILWSCKGVFDQGWGSVDHHCPRIGMNVLRAIKRLSKEFDFNVHFLSTDTFYPEKSWISRELGVLDLVKSLPKPHLHSLLPRDELMGIMSRCRLTTIVSGLLGSFAENIAMGSVPLCYSGHIYRDSAEKHGLKLPVFDATEDQIYDCIYRLYMDDEFYLDVIKDYRKELEFYSFESSYQYFTEMCYELFGKVW